MTQDPVRLSDDPGEPELARALREAQGDVLSPEAVARVRSALTAAGVAAAGGALLGGQAGAASPSALAKILGAATWLRVGLGALALVGIGLGGVALMRHTPNSPGALPAAVKTGESPPSPAQPVTTQDTSALPTAADALPTSEPTPATMGTARARASARPPAVAAVPSPREGALLLEARRALGTDPARALALVRAHAAEFPASQLATERARIAAEARQHLEK